MAILSLDMILLMLLVSPQETLPFIPKVLDLTLFFQSSSLEIILAHAVTECLGRKEGVAFQQ